MTDDKLHTVYRYHDATKHHPRRHARSLGYMDWANQPDPFLRFPDAHLLEFPPPEGPPATWDQALAGAAEPAPLTAASLSRLFWTSLALSAWKEVRGPDGEVASRWSLRVNPSSGNLHPTEAWVICGPLAGLGDRAAVHHYRADRHALEVCGVFDAPWTEIGLGEGRLAVALSSVVWREAWKYGERAFRYANHDVGHALAALDLAAAALGWSTRLVAADPGPLLRCADRAGPEQDHPDALVIIDTGGLTSQHEENDRLQTLLAAATTWCGPPAALSAQHHRWPLIDEVVRATAGEGPAGPPEPPSAPEPSVDDRELDFVKLVRGRRSAVAMDGRSALPAAAFFALLARTLPGRWPRPGRLLPWSPEVALVLFVHRVEGLEPGLYLLPRSPAQEQELRRVLRSACAWTRPTEAPDGLPLYQLGRGDLRAHARDLSCRQDIAADGAFAVGMLARFEGALTAGGTSMYRRLYWETGLVGQILYLEAEAAGLQGTGIGCFYDDVVHGILGIEDRSWQSLYHFTVGGGVSDERIGTAAAYAHLPADGLPA